MNPHCSWTPEWIQVRSTSAKRYHYSTATTKKHTSAEYQYVFVSGHGDLIRCFSSDQLKVQVLNTAQQ